MAYPSNNLTYRLVTERMHFNNPYIVLLWLLLSDTTYIALVYLGNPTNRIFTVIVFIALQLVFIYLAFAIRIGLNKFREFLEIDKKTDLSLRSLFISEDAFFKYNNQIIHQISSKWQLYFSILSFLFLIDALYSYLILHNESPFLGKGGLVWEMLIVLWYLLAGIIYFAGFGLVWALLCIIAGLMRLKDAEGLKIKESIKSFKTLVNMKQNNDEAVTKSLEGYYTYNEFVSDAGKITEFLLFFAVSIAILAIPTSVNWIVIEGLIFHNWIWYNIVFAILLDIVAMLIFISPMLSIHGVLKATKSEISNIINKIYERNKMQAVVQSASFSEIDEGLIKNMTFLKGIIDEANSLKTWPVDLEAIVKLTATTMAPIVLLIISKIIERII